MPQQQQASHALQDPYLDGEAQLAAAHFLTKPGASYFKKNNHKKRINDRSLHEEEVNETYEEYESQPKPKQPGLMTGPSVGLHARMAQLTTNKPLTISKPRTDRPRPLHLD